MPAPKLNNEDVKKIQKLLKRGCKPKDIAKKYGVHVSIIYRRVKYLYNAKFIPIETKNKIIKNINFTLLRWDFLLCIHRLCLQLRVHNYKFLPRQ